MQLVFFGSDLHQRAPEVIGTFYQPDTGSWIGFSEAIRMLALGHQVFIRPATETEIDRAEKRVVLSEMTYHLARATHEVLRESYSHEQIDDILTEIRIALQDLGKDLSLPNLVSTEN